MAIIECRNLGKDVSGRTLFSGFSFSIDEGAKIGVIGPNGCGKTSLLRVLAGADDDFTGTVIREPGRRIAFVPQEEAFPEGSSALDFLLEDTMRMRRNLGELEARMQTDHGPLVMERYADLRSSYDAIGGDDAEERAERSLERAGLRDAARTEARALSGGERNVLCLLKALMSSPDLLILDEPGNHLDVWGRAWLEDFLSGLPAAVLIVSHDRWLLDRTSRTILSFEAGGIARYAGNYSAARLERLKKDAAQGAGWQADRKRIERLEALVKRFEEIARNVIDPAWGKRLRARRKQLEREREQARDRPAGEGRSIEIDFARAGFKSTYALKVEGYGKRYGERVLLEPSGFDLLRGEKAAIIGPNGCGKTSFVRDVALATDDVEAAARAGIKVSPSARIGYVAQGREGFRSGLSVSGALEDEGAKPDEARKALRRFLFDRQDLDKPIETLSGGEFKRLQIAKAVFLKADFLILDEPTNHLDIPSREAVEEALAEFEGAVLVVSHDRYLLEAVAERVIEIRDRSFMPFDGRFSEFWAERGYGSARSFGPSRTGIDGRAKALAHAAEPKDGKRPGEAGADLARRIESLEAEKAVTERAARDAMDERDFAGARKFAGKAEKLDRLIRALYEEYCGE